MPTCQSVCLGLLGLHHNGTLSEAIRLLGCMHNFEIKSWSTTSARLYAYELYPVDGCRGFPTELTPRGWPCCIIRILEECTYSQQDAQNAQYPRWASSQCQVAFVIFIFTLLRVKMVVLIMADFLLILFYLLKPSAHSCPFMDIFVNMACSFGFQW